MLEYAIYKEPNGNILKAVEDFIWLKNRLVEDINRIEKKGVFLLDT